MTHPLPHIPAIEAERLRLRAPRLEFFEPCAAYFAADRPRPQGRPHSRDTACRIWASDAVIRHDLGAGA